MYQPTFYIPSAANIVPGTDNPSLISSPGADWWTMPLVIEGLTPLGDPHGMTHDNHGQQNLSITELALASLPAVPFAVPGPTCRIAGGLYCTLPLDGSIESINLHLRMHGHKHRQRQLVQCPWTGCSETLQWMNIPRHIQSIHLRVRFTCFDCGKSYTRADVLARHVASPKCNGSLYEEE